MKLKNIVIGLLTLTVLGMNGCSEDNLTVDESLNAPLLTLPKGEPGSIDEMIYKIYERYGTYVLYKFDEKLIRQEWTTHFFGEYIPVKPGNEEYVREMLTFIQENLFDNYTDDFVRRSLVYKIFLVDSVKESSLSSSYSDLVAGEHKYIIANVGPQLDEFTDARWTEIKNLLQNEFVKSFYGAATIKPTQFIALRTSGIALGIPTTDMDPLGEYDDYTYMFYVAGFVKWKNLSHGRPNSLTPDESQDFADFLTLLTTNGKTELTNVIKRFDKMKERIMVLVPYLNNVLNLNVVETQNQNCPEDPIPVDFFSQF